MQKRLSIISIDYYGNKILLPVVEEVDLYSTAQQMAKEIYKAALEMPEFKSSGTHITWQYLNNEAELNDFKKVFFQTSDSRKLAFIQLQKEDYAKIQEIDTPFGKEEFPFTSFASMPVIVRPSENSSLIIDDLLPNFLPVITLKLNKK